jgi:uncharacterized membrane protein
VRWYAAAGLVALASLALAALILWRFFAGLEEPARFLAPGRGAIEIHRPGPYVIWHEHRALFGGRNYDVPAAMPDGTRYRVTAPDGRSAALEAYRGATMNSEDAQRASLARFVAAVPGRHEVEVAGEFGPRVVFVQEDLLWPGVRAIGAAVAAAVLGIGAAVALVLYGLLQRAPEPRGAAVPEAGRERSLRELTAIIYGLQAASLLVGVTLFAAVLMNYMKRGEVAGTWLESHFTWQTRTFWWSLLWAVLGLATLVFLVGIVILLASAVWFIYRVVKGWIRLEDDRPMYA